jgi:cytochrome c oxidase subunit 4
MASTSAHDPERTLFPRTYLIVFGSLLGLTALTSYSPIGRAHTAVALAIAVAKASLVVLFFMHALESSRLVWLAIGGALLFLSIMMGLTLAGYWTRSYDVNAVRSPGGPPFSRTGEREPTSGNE